MLAGAMESLEAAELEGSATGQRRSSRRRPQGRSLPFATANLFYRPAPRDGLRLSGTKLQCLTAAPPNVFLIEDFLSDAELEHIGALVHAQGEEACFKGSFTEAAPGTHVYSEHRTSTFVWLGKQQDAIVSRIERRAADIVRVPSSNVEPLQIVSYTKGQQFKLHHDAGSLNDDGTVEAVEPRRIATVFVYLNTLPAGQGHTEFPELGLSVTPRRGSAVLFPNTTAEGAMEVRTTHRALPVTDPALRKFGMNVWVTAESVQALAMVDRRPGRARKGSKRKQGSASSGQAHAAALRSTPFMRHFAPGPADRLRCRACTRDLNDPSRGDPHVCAGCHYGWHGACTTAPPAQSGGPGGWLCERCLPSFCARCGDRFASGRPASARLRCGECGQAFHSKCAGDAGPLPCHCRLLEGGRRTPPSGSAKAPRKKRQRQQSATATADTGGGGADG